jgi:hypothetical protein
MTVTLAELDKLWDGANIDKDNMKLLCRKYGPHIIMEWIARGLSIQRKDILITWCKDQLKQLGEEVIEKPPEVKDERLFDGDFGDYFSE